VLIILLRQKSVRHDETQQAFLYNWTLASET
jgi:hypothetical protein